MDISELNDRLDRLAELLANDELSVTHLPDDTSVILDIDGHQVLSLNGTGAFLVKQIRDQGQTDATALVTALTEAFEVEADAAMPDVSEFIDTLTETLAPS